MTSIGDGVGWAGSSPARRFITLRQLSEEYETRLPTILGWIKFKKLGPRQGLLRWGGKWKIRIDLFEKNFLSLGD